MIAPETEIIFRFEGTELLRRTLRPGDYVIGRALGCDLCVISSTVSRKHARLTVNFSNLFLEDLGSFNGTTVNRGRISGKTQIWHGQQIQIGSVEVELSKICTAIESGGSLAPAQEAVLESLPEDVTFQHNGYKIGQLIGRGGMGAVLQAEDASIKRQVAMKVVLHGDSPKDVLRFIHEARITGRLEHPNIVPVHTLGADEHGQPFYTMKLVRGATLKQILNGLAHGEEDAIRNYPLHALLGLFQKVCDALRFAHSQKVIHRDLKPDNIMTGDYGEVLVMDWGLAKDSSEAQTKDTQAEEEPEQEEDEYDPHADINTRTGAILGTPQYMPPEQASGNIDHVDERADIYSLGAILYHILTLRPPIHPGTTEEMLGQVIRGEISAPTKAVQEDTRALTTSVPVANETAATPSQEHILSGNLPHLPAGKIPQSLEAIVLKAMARDPSERYPSVDEFQKDIAAYRRGFATEAEHAGLFKRLHLLIKRNVAASIASVVILMLSTAFGLGMAREAERSKQALARLRKAAPTFVERAWGCLTEGRLDEALEKVSFAIEIDPSNADYHLLRGRLLQAQIKLQDALDSFRQVLLLRKDWAAEENTEVCTRLLSKMKESGELPLAAKVELLHAMLRQGRKPDAAPIIAELRGRLSEHQSLLENHLSSIQGWEPRRLQATGMGTFVVDLSWLKFDSLEFLENLPVVELRLNGSSPSLTPEVLKTISQLPLSSLALRGCLISDLGFLAGTDIENLILSGNNCSDLTPISSLPLRKLNLRDNPVENLGPLASCWRLEEIVLPKKARILEPLRSLPSLKRISHRELPNGSPDLTTADFWKVTQPEEAKDFPQK